MSHLQSTLAAGNSRSGRKGEWQKRLKLKATYIVHISWWCRACGILLIAHGVRNAAAWMYFGDVLGIKSCPALHLILGNEIELSNELSDRSILEKKNSRRQFANSHYRICFVEATTNGMGWCMWCHVTTWLTHTPEGAICDYKRDTPKVRAFRLRKHLFVMICLRLFQVHVCSAVAVVALKHQHQHFILTNRRGCRYS